MKNLFIASIVSLSGCTYLKVETLIIDCSKDPIGLNIFSIKADCGMENGTVTITVTDDGALDN